MKRFYIGVVGTNGAGKSVICDYLATKGFAEFSLSSIVREEAARQGLALNRDNLVLTGNQLKLQNGEKVLAEQSYQKALARNLTYAVFDSVRHIKEVEYLKERRVLLLGVDAPIETRFKRVKQRRKATDDIDFATFQEQDERENSGKSPGQNIFQALAACDVTIQNTGDLTTLYKQVDMIIQTGIASA